MATINSASIALSDVQAAINAASDGDTVTIPSGSATWGASGAYLSVNKAITLQGAGQGATVITLSTTAGQYGSATIRVSAGATVKSFSVIQPDGYFPSTFTMDYCTGFRITDIGFTGSTSGSWFAGVDHAYGIFDHCTLEGNAGNAELIFVKGYDDSWQNAHTMGGANNVFIEDCVFNGEGYVCDVNANGRAVIRFNTINGTIKIDGHGKQSSSPRGVRHMEVYGNVWTNTGSNFPCIEMRGGTFRVFNNSYTGGGNPFDILLNEYYVTVGGLTSADWPYDDGIGVGVDPKVGGSAPAYLWLNRKNGILWARDNYGTYVDGDGVVDSDRDYFIEVASFNGSTGVGYGTKAAMNAITPSLTGVGYWVTDEASWRSGYANTSGQLYVWNGSAWVLDYTPYTYPHPLQSGGGSPAPGSLGDTGENSILDALFGSGFPATLYLALFTAAPTDAGGGTEVSGGSYARKAITNNSTNFPAAAARVKNLHVAQTFTTASASWGNVTHWAIYDASTAGNLIAWGPITNPKTPANGNSVYVPADAVSISLD